MSARSLAGMAIVVSFVVAVSAAQAAPIALSAIPLANDVAQKGPGRERVTDVKRVGNSFVTALDRPVCLQALDPNGSPANGVIPRGDAEVTAAAVEIDRLEPGAEPVLHHIVIDAASALPDATVIRHERIKLLRIETAWLSVYAYRTPTLLYILIPEGFASAGVAFERQIGRAGCGLASVALRVSGDVSMARTHPPRDLPDDERWVDWQALIAMPRKPARRALATLLVSVSLSKASRDPEPLLSVLVTQPTSEEPIAPLVTASLRKAPASRAVP